MEINKEVGKTVEVEEFDENLIETTFDEFFMRVKYISLYFLIKMMALKSS